MRFEDGRIDQFVSDKKLISTAERDELFTQFRRRGRDFIPVAVQQVKNSYSGSDTGFEDLTEEQAEFIRRAGDLAENGYQDDPDAPKKKLSWFPLIVVIATFAVVIVGSFFGGMAYAFGGFFLGVALLGFYAAKSGNARGYTFYGGTNSGSAKTAGIMIGIIGIAGAIPMFFSGFLGLNGTLLVMGAILFAAIAVMMLAGFIKSLSAKKKYSEEISANCVGYVRTVDSHSSGSGRRHGHNARGYIMRTSPIFEYTYQGKDYKGIYDRMIDGIDADVNMGVASIAIDPKHPEDIYHKSTGVQVKGLIVSIICFALCGVFAMAFLNGGFLSGNGSSVPGMDGFTIFKIMTGSDEERENIFESMGDDIMNNFGYQIPYEIEDDLVEKRQAEFAYIKGQTWYYELATIERIDEFDNGEYSIVFEDRSLPQLGKHGDHDDIGDTRIVFYVANEYESNGETKIEKEVFWDLSPAEHTYVGAHGAYEG